MSLRKLTSLFDFEIKDQKPLRNLVTLAFALNYSYLEPFKVMLTSMVKSSTALDCPISVYSYDERVLCDPVVQLVANKVSLVKGAKKALLYDLAENHVKRKNRDAWNKETFLKWAVFEEHETNQVLFLDVDMLVIRDIEGLLNTQNKCRFLCCPQFGSIKEKNDVPVPINEQYDVLAKMLDGAYTDRHTWRVNSGMMLLRGDILSRAFFDEIVDFARCGLTLHEQGHLSNYFRHREDIFMLPVTWNFQESFLSELTESQRNSLVSQVNILHYAGKSKPWVVNLKPDSRPTALLWHAYRTLSGPLLSLA
jgi:lipopolysaccharide biosynthesis glycosyltransferase